MNEFDRAYLVDVFRLETKELVKYNWTQEEYKKRVEEEENRLFRYDGAVNPEVSGGEVVRIIEECMHEKYLTEKDKYGLTLDP